MISGLNRLECRNQESYVHIGVIFVKSIVLEEMCIVCSELLCYLIIVRNKYH